MKRRPLDQEPMGIPSATERRTLLGMPGYGQVTPGAAKGFWRASAIPSSVIKEYFEGSLLAANFNRLWVTALNKRHRGEQIDYFAMQHSDVEPEDFWLDKLIDEMEAQNLDVLGVVVPIKDTRGVTSIALAHPSGDPWRIHCRLTMKEIFRLPETFTNKDLGGHKLLLNTGLWVCRFDPAWARQMHFEVNDRIVFNKNTNRYEAQVEPEDWFFSRLLHEQELAIGATRKIRLAHAGINRVRNTHPWGSDEYDSDYVNESPVAVASNGFRFPSDVDGWLDYQEGLALFELARDKRVLEIGSYCGKSTVCLAQSASHVIAIDPHDGRGTPRAKDTLEEFKKNLSRYGVAGKVGTVKATSSQILESGSLARFDLVFIDGAHDYDSVKIDIRLGLDRLAPGGVLAFHDYRATPGQHDGRWDPGVTQAVNELLADGGELISIHGTLAVVRPPALVPVEV